MTAITRVALPSVRTRNIALIVLASYLVGMAFVGFWPTPVDRDAAGTIRQVLTWSHAHGIRWLTYSLIEESANVAFFIPLGALLAIVLRRRWWLAPLLVLAATSSIELGQYLFLPHRVASLTDIATNTVGGLTAIAVVIALRWLRSARRSRPRPFPVVEPVETITI